MNLGQLRAAVKLRLKLPVAGDAYLTDAVVNTCINTALIDMSTATDWPWNNTSATATFSTSTGLATIPADCIKVRELVVNGRPAKHVGFAEFLDAAVVGSGRFVWNEDQGASIGLAPIPTVAPTAKLYYLRSEPALVADGDLPALPVAYHTVLVARAAYLANVARRFDGDATLDLAEFTDGLKKMKQAAVRRTGTRQIRSAYRQRNWATW